MATNILPLIKPRKGSNHARRCELQGWVCAAFYRPAGHVSYCVTLLCSKGGVHAAYVAPTKAAAQHYTERFTRRYLWAGGLVERGEFLPIMWE